MIRTCDGTDPTLLDSAIRTAGPCACGLTFDDNDRSVIYPHAFIPTADDIATLRACSDSIAVDPVWTQAELDGARDRARRRFAALAPFID